MDKVNIKSKFELFNEYWSPKIIGEVNESHVKIAKIKGEFIWHVHKNEDEMFLVLKGKLVIRLRDRDIELSEGEMFIVPRGIEHLPVAEEEVHIMMIEPKGTLNTGNIKNERTVENLDLI